MKHSKRLELFEKLRVEHTALLTSILWKLTGDKELFTEALQYSLLEMWRHTEKLSGKKAGAYIYRIALSANSRAWRNRIGRDGQISEAQVSARKNPSESVSETELAGKIRLTISQLPVGQAKAITMRYLQQQSYESIADKLNCSPAGARSHVSKALAKLKNSLAKLNTEVQ